MGFEYINIVQTILSAKIVIVFHFPSAFGVFYTYFIIFAP